MEEWDSEITNNPNDDFNLYIEIIERDNYVGRIYRDRDNMLKLQLYSDKSINIPCEWLSALIESARKDI